MKVYDTVESSPTFGTYVIDPTLTLEEEFLLDKKTPVEELSKGEKIVYALTFLPSWKLLE